MAKKDFFKVVIDEVKPRRKLCRSRKNDSAIYSAWFKKNENKMPSKSVLLIYYEHALTWYGLKNLSKSLLCIKQVLRVDKDMERTVRLSAMTLEMVLQYETGEQEHLIRLLHLLHKELLHYRLSGSYYGLCCDWLAESSRRR